MYRYIYRYIVYELYTLYTIHTQYTHYTQYTQYTLYTTHNTPATPCTCSSIVYGIQGDEHIGEIVQSVGIDVAQGVHIARGCHQVVDLNIVACIYICEWIVWLIDRWIYI